MEYLSEGSPQQSIDETQAARLIGQLLDKIGGMNRVLLIPPDYTRFHSWAGELTVLLYHRLKQNCQLAILPAVGTHFPMTETEIKAMFPGIPLDCFRAHDWRNDVIQLGTVPGDYIKSITAGQLDYEVECEVNRLLIEGNWDRIISIGQLVPHEVIGIANHRKNIYVGTGGRNTISKTHFIGAVCNMETIMGRRESPVRQVLSYMDAHFGSQLPPITYLMTVREMDEKGHLITRGLFAGDDDTCFQKGARLCQKVNITLLNHPLKKVVVYLDPGEYKSTWLGNKSIYRTRMAIESGGTLIVLAPGIRQFGEDAQIDEMIRKYGYHGTPYILKKVRENEDLRENLSAAAHLIHSSSEGRFQIIYSASGLSEDEIRKAGFDYANLDEMVERYNPARLKDGFNTLPGGEEIFYISNPALGLWALQSHFEKE